VWAPSAHVAGAIAAVSPIPVTTTRIPVELPPILPRSREELGIPNDFVFLFSFDYRSVFERKNPLATIGAFTSAFGTHEGANLVLKCINADADPVNHNRLRVAAAEHPKVHVIDSYLSPQEKDALTAACDCYVSLHRSEGFGYTMAEAMYCGKPVIATGYSGNLEFMTQDNALLVDHRLVPIGADAAPYPPEGEWAEPDVEHASTLMRMVFEDRQLANDLSRRAAHDIRRTHSAAAVGERMEFRLKEVRASQGAWRRARSGRRPRPLDAALTQRIAGGPAAFAPRGRGRLRGMMRRALLRLLRPLTAYQQTVNVELARSLEALSDELALTRGLLARSNAALLASLRRQEPLQTLPAIVDAQRRLLDDIRAVSSHNSRGTGTLEGEGDRLDLAAADQS
jgi:hypothetical protein